MPRTYYQLSLAMNDTVYKAKAITFPAALAKINPPFFKSRGIFTLTKGGKTSSHSMNPAVVKHLFVNKTAQLIFEKRMMTTLR